MGEGEGEGEANVVKKCTLHLEKEFQLYMNFKISLLIAIFVCGLDQNLKIRM
jgi:hypothetical protein